MTDPVNGNRARQRKRSAPSFSSPPAAIEGNSIIIVTIDALTKLAWPILGLFAILLFRQPIVDTLATIQSEGGTLEINGLKVTISAHSVPAPSPWVKEAMADLGPDEIQFISFTDPGHPLSECADTTAAIPVFARLAQRKLLAFETDRSHCDKPTDVHATVQFLPLFADVRRFMLAVLYSLRFHD